MNESVTQRSEPAQPSIIIRVVSTSRLRRAFVELPYRLYAGQGCWVPPLRRDEYRRIDPAHNPFLEHATLALWVAERQGQIVGRIAGIDDRLHNQTHREHVAWFGLFEAVDADVASALLQAVERWARARGSALVRGPANLSLNESAGLLVDAFDQPPRILMPYNPPTYPGFVEASGYVMVKDLLAWDIDIAGPVSGRIGRIASRVGQRHGITIRTADLAHFDRDLAIFQSIYDAAWEDNWGFVPPTDAEIRQLAVDLKPIFDPQLMLFAEMRGQTVACVIGIPNVNQVLARMNGRLFPFGFIHFLRRRTLVNELRLLLLGVVPEVRRIGLYPLMIQEIYQRAQAQGYVKAELSWTLEDNDLINTGIVAAGGYHSRTYRLYDKPLG